jgi:tetratricopeptide (TPR) repeat protein
LDLGVLYREMGSLDRSIEVLRRAYEQFCSVDDSAGQVMSLLELGNSHRVHIQLQVAFDEYEAASRLAASFGDNRYVREAAFAELNKGIILTGWSRYDEACTATDRALNAFISLEDSYGSARAAQRHGWIARLRGHIVEAKVWHERALDYIKPFAYSFAESEIIHSLGNVYRSEGDFRGAMAQYNKALATFEASGATRHGMVVKNDIGVLALEEGERSSNAGLIEFARDALESVVSERTKAGQSRELSASLFYLAIAHMWQGRYQVRHQLDTSR